MGHPLTMLYHIYPHTFCVVELAMLPDGHAHPTFPLFLHFVHSFANITQRLGLSLQFIVITAKCV